jgi:hypothetical protein
MPLEFQYQRIDGTYNNIVVRVRIAVGTVMTIGALILRTC